MVKACINGLLGKWIRECGGDLIATLTRLDVVVDADVRWREGREGGRGEGKREGGRGGGGRERGREGGGRGEGQREGGRGEGKREGGRGKREGREGGSAFIFVCILGG